MEAHGLVAGDRMLVDERVHDAGASITDWPQAVPLPPLLLGQRLPKAPYAPSAASASKTLRTCGTGQIVAFTAHLHRAERRWWVVWPCGRGTAAALHAVAMLTWTRRGKDANTVEPAFGTLCVGHTSTWSKHSNYIFRTEHTPGCLCTRHHAHRQHTSRCGRLSMQRASA